MSSLANLVKEHRLKKGFNKAELGRLIGVTDVSINYYENGKVKQMGHERLGRLAQVLDISLYELLGIDENEHFPLAPELRESKSELLSKLSASHEKEEGVLLSSDELDLLVKGTSLRESLSVSQR